MSCSSLVAPWRLLSFFLSVPNSSGMCRNVRHRSAQRLVDDDLLGRVAEVVVAADHVRDLHGHVVDDDSQVVGDGAVGALHDEVADRGVVELHRIAQHVVEDRLAGRHVHAQREGLARRPVRRSTSSARERPAPAASTPRRASRPAPPGARPRARLACRSRGTDGRSRAASRCTRGRWAGARSDGTAPCGPGASGPSSQSSPISRIELRIWAIASSVLRERSVSSMRRMNVPPLLAREDVVVQARAGAAQVQVARRRRGEADDDGPWAAGLGCSFIGGT